MFNNKKTLKINKMTNIGNPGDSRKLFQIKSLVVFGRAECVRNDNVFVIKSD